MTRLSTTGALAAAALMAAGAASDALAQQTGSTGGFFNSIFPGGRAERVQYADPSQPTFNTSGAEWGSQFDPTSNALHFSATSDQPTLSPRTVANIQQAIEMYRGIASRGGWGFVPGDQVLSIGSSHPNVAALRQRLIASGDLNPGAGVSNTFDTYVEAAVRRFQERHGLVVDGVVRGETIEALNVPVETRIQQLQTNLVRVNSMSGDLGGRYVLVNIPAAQVEAVDNGTVASRHTAVVGKVDRQSPILTDQIDYISFNPFWTVPKSIIRKDIIPKMREDPDYLTEYKIRIFNNQGQELDPTTVDWSTEEAVSYMLKQDPGDQNSLGSIRINFPNEHAVYLHDTPQQNLFGTNNRFHSSGCVRVQNVRALVDWLLQPTGNWSRAKIDSAVRSGEQLDVSLRQSTPIYFSYITAWSNDEGVVNFRPDIYNRDGMGPAVAQDF